MKKLVFIALAIFLSGTFLAAQEKSDKQTDQVEKQEQRVTEPVPQKKTQQLPPTGEPWPRTFVPSEKINADTVVSFPADI